jgi:hypothetical protein
MQCPTVTESYQNMIVSSSTDPFKAFGTSAWLLIKGRTTLQIQNITQFCKKKRAPTPEEKWCLASDQPNHLLKREQIQKAPWTKVTVTAKLCTWPWKYHHMHLIFQELLSSTLVFFSKKLYARLLQGISVGTWDWLSMKTCAHPNILWHTLMPMMMILHRVHDCHAWLIWTELSLSIGSRITTYLTVMPDQTGITVSLMTR